MKEYYDKALFLASFVLFALGVGLFFEDGGIQRSAPFPAINLSGGKYVAIPAPSIGQFIPTWPRPPDQGEDNPSQGLGWTYDIFTPPKIHWDSEFGLLTNQSVIIDPAPQVPPFGMVFVRVNSDPYRIQFQGLSGQGNRNDTIVFLDEQNHESNFHLSLAPGQSAESTAHKIRVLDLTFTDNDAGHGLLNKVAQVKIFDEQTNEEVTLTQGKTYSPSNYRYFILHTEGPLPSEDWEVTAVGDKKEYPGELLGFKGAVTYEVVAVDFDKPSVTVVRHSVNKKGVEVVSAPQVLSDSP